MATHQVGNVSDHYISEVLSTVKERLTFISDFWEQASFFFVQPDNYDLTAVKPKWSVDKMSFFQEVNVEFSKFDSWDASALETFFKGAIQASGMKMGELMMPFRIMLVGGKFGPDVFQIVSLLGKEEVIARVDKALIAFSAE
ncbi:Glutamate--tRNA ligase [compost metagenome]